MALGKHAAQGGPMMTRRAALACAIGAVGAAGLLAVLGCERDDASVSAGSDATDAPAGSASIAHQTAAEGAGGIFYVDFSSGSIVRTDRSGATREVIYSNGQVNHLGVRYLVCDGGDVFFCDAPSASLRAVPAAGGEARTVLTSSSATVLPLPLLIEDGRVYLSMLDGATMASTLASVGCDGADYREHLTLPANFYAQYVDVPAGRVYYSGVSADDERQIRSSALDGSDELVLFSLDGVPSASSSITWQLFGGRLYVQALDSASSSNTLTSRLLDGTDEQLVHNFTTQRVSFDLFGGNLYFVDHDTLAVLASTLDEPAPRTVATVPTRAAGTTVSAIEAGDGVVWIMTVTPGVDNANEYVTYMVDVEAGSVVELA